MKTLGVDGCPGGWVAVSETGVTTLFASFQVLVEHSATAKLYVDMPMGLTSDQPRSLERDARKLLPGRRSSIFTVPSRDAVYATSYASACDVNQRRFGKKLSVQVWNICRKIREVDRVLTQSPDLSQRIFESHPELVFQRLNGGALQFKKKTREGIEERLSILGRFLPSSRNSYEQALNDYPRKLLARDDIVDAMSLAVVGQVPQHTIVDAAGVDEHGIPIRMVIPE